MAVGHAILAYDPDPPRHTATDRATGRPWAEAYRGDTPVDMMDKPLRVLPTYPQA